ncbi:lamin tail domain-containing protein [Streptomyces kebangsaanensis]|uniref:Lamin tail domain-containing protein n=1 Tax=Streptomyces kebangsaanensis TaxID=864058 RepID=A0ABW6KRS1_9ACTN
MTARRLAAAVAAAGALVGTVTLPASAADHAPRQRENVVISSVHLDSGRDHRSNHALNQEWVAITNNSRHSVNMRGWTLSDQHGHRYTFRHYRLDGRATVRVHTGMGRDTHRDLYQDRHNQIWDRRDTATLRNERGRVVDTLKWGNNRHDNRHDDRRNDRHDDRRDDRRDDRHDNRRNEGHHRADHR